MDLSPAVLLLVAVNVASIYFAGQIASRRGRSFKTWLWLAAIFGPLALAAVALLPPANKDAMS